MKSKWVVILLLLPLVVSCGYQVEETITPVVPVSNYGKHKKVVILPFADYSPGSSPQDYWRRNVLVSEAIQDEFNRHGFVPAVQEDVISYLLERGIIKETGIMQNISPETITLNNELDKEWSAQMQGELARAIYQNISRAEEGNNKYWSTERLISLDHQTLRSLGYAFTADYVVRGRIVDFSLGEDDSFNPVQTGILPFFFKFGQRTVFGVAQSDNYEMIDKMAIGALMGAGLAPSDFPIGDDTESAFVGHPRFGGEVVSWTTDYAAENALIWGAIGAVAAHLAHKGGRVNRADVQLRMVVQDPATGGIVWANRAQVKVTPKSAYGDSDYDALLSQAIRHSVASLMQNFLASRHSGIVVKRDPSGALVTYPKQ
jgi:hypothetical protein